MRFGATCQRSACEEQIWVSAGYFPNFSGLNSEDSSYRDHDALNLASCAQQDVCANPLRISPRATIKPILRPSSSVYSITSLQRRTYYQDVQLARIEEQADSYRLLR